MKQTTDKVTKTAKEELKINAKKAISMKVAKNKNVITVSGKDAEQVNQFKYLCNSINGENNSEVEVNIHIGKAATAFKKRHNICKSIIISIKTKIMCERLSISPAIQFRNIENK